jgi:hypothetical protein
MALKPIHIALNALDHLPPANYSNAILYLPLKSNVRPKEVFNVLQEGLHRTFVQLPWLDGSVYPVSPTQPGARPGLLEIRFYPCGLDSPLPQQLKFNELDASMDFEELRESAFHPEIFEDEALTWAPFLPDVTNGAKVFVAQANFMPGGCILTAAVCHVVSDGAGANGVLNTWAANCRDVQLGNKLQATLPPEISDHELLERTWAKEVTGRPNWQIPPEAWRLLGFEPPASTNPQSAATNGQHKVEDAPAPDSTKPQRVMKSYLFYISPTNVRMLRETCIKELGETDISINDAICALVWRCLIRSRMAAKAISSDTKGAVNGSHQQPGHADDNIQVRLDLPFDVRPYFPQSLPPNYLGNFTMINQALLPLSYLLAPSTSLGSVARTIRQGAGDLNAARLMDAYTLAKMLPGLGPRPKLQNLRVDGNGLMITSLLAFPMTRFCFGEELFANGGNPEAMRPLLGAVNKLFRQCSILPIKSHRGVEFIANMFDTELELLMEDEEFGKYAMFVA